MNRSNLGLSALAIGNDGPRLALKQCIGPTKVAQRIACGNLDTGLGSRGLSRGPKGESLGTCRQGRCQFRREWQGALDDGLWQILETVRDQTVRARTAHFAISSRISASIRNSVDGTAIQALELRCSLQQQTRPANIRRMKLWSYTSNTENGVKSNLLTIVRH
jgi:hypothetical protein